jgi:hypothetical protein
MLVDACCYVVRTGCLGACFRKTFRIGTTRTKPFAAGVLRAALKRCAMWRAREARHVQPSHAILDVQCTRSSPQGYDAGKKVKGRKRNLVVDTLGLVLAVSVCAASLQDRDAGTDAVARAAEKYPTLQRLFVDTAYAGQWGRTATPDCRRSGTSSGQSECRALAKGGPAGWFS